MDYIKHTTIISRLKNHAVMLFMDFRFMDPEDDDRDKLQTQINDLSKKITWWEDQLYKKYGCGVDRIMLENCKNFSEAVSESIPLRDLWHSFDSSSSILNPDIIHPVAAEMLLSSPKWFVHMEPAGIGEIHKRNVLKNIEVVEMIDDGYKQFAMDLDVLMFRNGSTIKFDKQLTAPGVCGEQPLSGAEENVNVMFTYDPFNSGQMAIEDQKEMIKCYLGLEAEMQNNFKVIIEIEFKWLHEINFYNIPHLYNIRTGISCCGKSRATNTAQMDLFSSALYPRKCKLCLRTKIGRILK